jgi:hypothetical protein
MILLDILPSAEADERLTWATDVIQTYSREQRICLRQGPRAAFAVRWTTDNAGLARLRTRAAWQSRDEYGLPIWWQMSEPIDIDQSDTSITVDTTQANYRSWVAVLDGTNVEALAIDAVHAGSVDLVTPADRDYRGVRIAPIVLCEAPNGFDFERAGQSVNVSAVLACANNPDLGHDPNPLHEGYPVLLSKSTRQGDFGESDQRELDYIDAVAGSPYSRQMRGVMDRTRTVARFVQGRAESWALLQWVHARRGRLRAFWLPSWNADMQLAAPVAPANTSITIKNQVWREAGVRCVLIETDDGTRVVRKVTGIALSGNNEVVTISAQLGVSSARLICVVDLVRLESDTITIRHRENGITSFSAACVEVPA